jgi:hypothetical protein
MGIYINPNGKSKEAWLNENAIHQPKPIWPAEKGKMFVCLVDNGFFRAAGVAYHKNEFEAFNHPDPRPKSWWIAPIDSLLEDSAGLSEFDRAAIAKMGKLYEDAG